jgi:hypothetical protein
LTLLNVLPTAKRKLFNKFAVSTTPHFRLQLYHNRTFAINSLYKMQLVKPLVRSALRPFQLKPWIPSEIEPTRLSLTHLLEEEHCPTYKAESYYPMRLGEILNNKYQVCMKFGWGTTATVWVARDLDW